MNIAPGTDSIERKCELYLQHPDECPELIGVLPYVIHPPSKLSATARWIAFRDKTVIPMIAAEPDDQNLPNFLKQIEAILAWRATIAAEDRFWKAVSRRRAVYPASAAQIPSRC